MKKFYTSVIIALASMAIVSCGNKSALEGYWMFDTVNGEKVVTSEKPAYLQLSEGRINGCLGVNLIHGYYELDFCSEIDFEGLGMTMMMGLPQDNMVESKLQSALDVVESYKVKGDVLTLYGDKRTPVLTLVKSAQPINPDAFPVRVNHRHNHQHDANCTGNHNHQHDANCTGNHQHGSGSDCGANQECGGDHECSGDCADCNNCNHGQAV